MSNAVRAAVLGLLEATVLNVHDGYVTDSDESAKTVSAPLPYVVLHMGGGEPDSRRVGGASPSRGVEVQVTFVGVTPEQALWAAEKADVALADKAITVGSQSRQVRPSDDNDWVRRDDQWTRPDGKPLFFGALRYTI